MGNRRDGMTVNTEVKGTLARLLATENLKVEHRQVSTACFDVSNRILVLPIWKTASATVYDLLVGHEVGHALYTPNEDFGDAPKDFVNVLEDARIEKFMKRTYPGLRKSFYEGYQELWNQDFFGVKSSDISKLSLIDRINLFFKGNSSIEFSAEEMVFVDRASKTNTFQEVIDLAMDLYEFAKQKQMQKEDIDLENSTQSGSGESADQNDVEVDPQDSQDDENSPTESSGKSIGSDPSNTTDDQEDYDYDETQSLTEEALRQSLETLVDDSAKEWVYLNLPEVDLDDYLVPWKKIQTDLEYTFHGRAFSNKQEHDYFYRNLNFSYQKCEDYKKSAQKSVNYLVKQFEMKKSADQYARSAVSRTGILDTNKLHTYRYNEDIFKKVTVIPEGKNHGLIMLLDWSGSMQNVLMDTLKQTYNLIWFCRKVNIPFRVYAFQSGYTDYRGKTTDYAENVIHLSEDFRLLEFFSSQMNSKALDTQMKYIWQQAWGQHSGISHPSYSLGGTPLGESVICMRDAVKKLKRFEKVQKVNVVALTDGESNPLSYTTSPFPEDHYFSGKIRTEYFCHNRNKVFILRDPVTGYSRRFDTNPYNTTSEIVSFYKEITDYNWIGIRLCSKGELNRFLVNYLDHEEVENASKQWAKEKFTSVSDKTGFTKQFFMPNQYIGSGTEDLDVKIKGDVATKAELQRAFKKHMGSKMANKTILNAFIEQIA